MTIFYNGVVFENGALSFLAGNEGTPLSILVNVRFLQNRVRFLTLTGVVHHAKIKNEGI